MTTGQTSSAAPGSPIRIKGLAPSRGRPRRLGGLLRWAGFVFTVLALGLLGLWAFGRIVSDRWTYSQYVAWIPTWLLILPALILIVLGIPARGRRAGGRPSRVFRGVHSLAALLGLAASLHLGFVELRLHRFLTASPGGGSTSLRIMHWNLVAPDAAAASGAYADVAATLGPPPDVYFLTTAQSRATMEAWAATLTGYDLAYEPPFAIYSRFPILYAELLPMFMNRPGGPTEIDAPGAASPSGTASPDAVDPALARPARNWLRRVWNRYGPSIGLPYRLFPQGEIGYVMPVTLDTTVVLGRPITVWFIDLPSDPFIFRWELARFAQARIEEFKTQTNPRTGTPLLPDADLILGDTNVPRGSASLGLITAAAGPGFEHAFDQAGRGLVATWPRAWPALHIDHAFVAPWLRAAGYWVGEPPVSDHLFQIIDIEKR